MGIATRTPQGHENATYAPMLTKELSEIDWIRSAQQIHDQVRGLIPWPCAKTILQGVSVKVFCTIVGGAASANPGSIISADKQGIEVACGDGKSILITELQPDGGKRMTAAAYLAGHPIQVYHE